MPKRKRGSGPMRSRKRRKYARRRYPLTRQIRSAKSGFPRSIKVRLTYSDEHSFTGLTAGAASEVKYYCNSIYDPEVAIGGHQPMYRDTYSNVYKKYRVTRSRIKCLFFAVDDQGTSYSASHQYKCYVFAQDNEIQDYANTTVTYMEEHPLTGTGKVLSLPTAQGHSTMGATYNPRKIYPKTWREHGLSSMMGANPESLAAFFVVVVPLDPTQAVNGRVKSLVTITYDVVLTDLEEPVQS